jgi:molybdate transport system substrate-binding protein
VLLLAAACGGGGRDGDTDTSAAAGGTAAQPGAAGSVTVLAAASLTEPLTTLARDYEHDHPGVHVALSFGSSTTLAQQVAEGAPADVVALAGTTALAVLPEGAARNGGQATIARNAMQIATPPDNPGRVGSIDDLRRQDLEVVLCAATVPCGKAADTVLQGAGIAAHVVSREVDVKATLAKVRLGEADAGIVYHSDVVSAGDSVHSADIPAARNTTLAYPMLWLNRRTHTVGFTRLVTGPTGIAVLGAAGFLRP